MNVLGVVWLMVIVLKLFGLIGTSWFMVVCAPILVSVLIGVVFAVFALFIKQFIK